MLKKKGDESYGICVNFTIKLKKKVIVCVSNSESNQFVLTAQRGISYNAKL